MPIYDYRCKKCSHEFEVSASISEKETLRPRCPKCKSDEASQIFRKVQVVDSVSTPEPPPEMPQQPPMGGCASGMCDPSMYGGF